MIRTVFALFALPLVCLMLCLPPTVQASSSRTTPAAKTARTTTPSDALLDATIRAKLAKSKVGKDGFRFHVARGVVTWEGQTNVVQHKGAATRMARTAGAAQVVNNIQVSASGKAKAAASLRKATLVQ